MAVQWYALRSKPQKEDVLWSQLKMKGVEVFHPRLKVNPVNPRSKKVRPYFPGYMFIQADLEETGLSAFRWMPHAIGLVTFGGEPANVPENLIHAIRKKVEEIAAAGGEFLQGLESGDKVRIESGPFEGYKGISDERLPGKERVRVLLELLNDQKILVELDAGQVRPAKKKKS